MWSFEKLHRCFAHLFLGQLVSNFDEEFRILYAQSQPMTMENLPAPKEIFVPLPERQYLTDRSVRESRKHATVDNPGPDERSRHNLDERGDKDWKNMPHNRHEDMYMNPSQQLRMGQPHTFIVCYCLPTFMLNTFWAVFVFILSLQTHSFIKLDAF
jgi:hypothetical protein